MSVLLFLSMRVLHVLLAAAWFGAVAFTAFYLGPTIQQLGPAGGPVIGALVRRGMPAYMASIGGLTIVTGIYLFWHFTGGFDPAISSSRAGMAYSIGALTGVIALVLGGGMIGRNVRKLTALGAQMAAMPDGAERAALMKSMEHLRGQVETFTNIVLILLTISIATMALGHYI